MLIQPYIENAIVHGLIPKNQNGEIKLEIHSENDLYHCIITDNGIGRQKALQLKNSSANPHKSIGMSVTKSRLELINIISNIKITEKVTDLFDNENNPIGTQIDIFIPRNFS